MRVRGEPLSLPRHRSTLPSLAPTTPSSSHLAGTVGTCVDHPRAGPTQLFRRGQDMGGVQQIFDNPRTHTGKRAAPHGGAMATLGPCVRRCSGRLCVPHCARETAGLRCCWNQRGSLVSPSSNRTQTQSQTNCTAPTGVGYYTRNQQKR